MKQLTTCLVVLMVLSLAAGTISLAQEEEKPRIKITGKPEGGKVRVIEKRSVEEAPEVAEKRVSTEEMSEQDAAWMAAGAPGEAHEFLKKMLGSWEVKLRFTPAPGAEPMTGRGQARRGMVLGDRFIQTTFKGEFMGDSFIGMGFDGYDNLKKKYVTVWMDNTSTMIFHTEGDLDESGKVLTSYGEYVDALSGKTKKTKTELTIHSLSMQSYVSYDMNEEGEWVKTMEVIYGKL
jgi:hypothetical protein